ncbi:MAG: D-alanine--D-alanine ligase [candidate division WOR-3 bacterium]|nr:MAG: D-alanine--D-alanine ligase [candidate division WOR-3 bacterium]
MDKERRLLQKKVIGVLYGGWSSEREISLGSGTCVIKALKRQGFKVKAIDVQRDLTRKLKGIDIAFNALHGHPGEDGTIQGVLDFLGIPYTGSGVIGSAIGMDKIISKRLFEAVDIPTPPYYYDEQFNIDEAIAKLDFPVVVKPRAEGSSVGVTIVDSKKELERAARKARRYGTYFFEKYIPGMMATCGILSDVPLPILEIAPRTRKFYDYKSKYTKGMTEYIIPARIPEKNYKETQKYALAAHRAIGAHGFSRVDFVLGKNHQPYVLEVNTIPGLLSESNLPLEARAMGLGYDELIYEILKTSLKRL